MEYCSNNLMSFYELIGILILIVKCFIPLIIIFFGTFDIISYIINIKKDNAFDKIKHFIKRVIVGIIIFFLPTIIIYIFEQIDFDESLYTCAYECVLDIKKCK